MFIRNTFDFTVATDAALVRATFLWFTAFTDAADLQVAAGAVIGS